MLDSGITEWFFGLAHETHAEVLDVVGKVGRADHENAAPAFLGGMRFV
jgi:hypothetical protein